jgi:hypothetical protein
VVVVKTQFEVLYNAVSINQQQQAGSKDYQRTRTGEFVVDVSTPNIDEVEKRVESAGEISKDQEIVDDTCPQQRASKASEVRVHLDIHPELGWRTDDATRNPLSDLILQLDSRPTTAFLAISKESILENHTVSVDQDSDKRLSIQKALHVGNILLANQ